MSFYSPYDILTHLQEYVPRLSDRFSTNDAITAEIIAGDPQILRITDTGHGLSADDLIVLSRGRIDNPITAAVYSSSDDTIRFTTENDHDLTADYANLEVITLDGFTDSQFNGEFQIVSVPNRKTFEISGTSQPILNGNEVLREIREIGINGLKNITRVIDPNTYEIDLIGIAELTPGSVPPGYIRSKDFRIAVAVDADRAVSLYTPVASKDELWMYVIMGGSVTSKSRTLKNDANQLNVAGQTDRPLNINTFSIVVFYPTGDETAAALAVQLSYNEIYQLMLSVASGISFDDFGNSEYLTSLIGHDAGRYDKAYYSHVYDFEYNFEVTTEQEFLTTFIESRAYRDTGIIFNELQAGSTEDLDEDA